jgi:hypothetical protein
MVAPALTCFGPFRGLPLAAADISAQDAGFDKGTELLSPGLATLVLLAWIGVAFAAAGKLLRRRDVE